MNFCITVCLLACAVIGGNALAAPGSTVAWDNLIRTWRIDPTNNAFVPLPRTLAAARAQGWQFDKGCGDMINANQPMIGNRYILDGDRMNMVLFDSNGNVAGVSAAIPKNSTLKFGFPSPNIISYFMDDGDYNTLAAYFYDPASICRGSVSDGVSTGDRVVIANTKQNLVVPMLQSEVGPFWTQGGCFHGMGQHYWADVSGIQVGLTTTADNLLPFFTLYNQGKLNGFGWSLNWNTPSPNYEHMPLTSLPIFFKVIPTAFYDPTQTDTLSSMHYFLDSVPSQNAC